MEWILEHGKEHLSMGYYLAKTNHLEKYLVTQKEHLAHGIRGMLCGSAYSPLSEALEVVDSIELVGVLENGLNLFLQDIYKMVDLKWDGTTPKVCAFEDLSKTHEHCEKIEKEPITPIIEELLEEITQEEQIIYEFAKNK
jgi:hypothetical protein